MPYIKYDVIFYSLLTVFGVLFAYFYVKKIEKISLKNLGWDFKGIKKNIAFGLLAYVPLIAFFPLVIYITGITISFDIFWQKILIGIEFGLIMGGFFEEAIFRGIIQKHLNSITDPKKSIIYTALIFVATHLFYLPFDGFGIYYYFITLMAILLSILRYKLNLLSCSILHGGIVFILILFV
jgi:membrane protease YdiL (CAAX protease family)